MILNGKTVECPKLEDMHKKYKGIFQKLEMLIQDPVVLNEVKDYLIDLEWCELYYKLIEKEHGSVLTPERKRVEYGQFYENILKNYFSLKPYLYCPEEPKLNIPPRKANTYKMLESLLKDDKKAFDFIKKFYPFDRKRKNKRELQNEKIDRTMKMRNKEDLFRYLKWQYVQPVENKEFIFNDVYEGRSLFLYDENENQYARFTKLIVTCIEGNIPLKKDIDYKIDSESIIIILPPLLQKCKDIKVTISTKLSKFKRFSV